MRKLPTLLALLTGACGRLAHIDPEPRAVEIRSSTVVSVMADCPPWYTREGTGFMISENRVVTAAHVVACPSIPRVIVYDREGRVFHMDAFEDRAVFGDGTDVARLQLPGAYDRFNRHIIPPAVKVPELGDRLCAFYYDGKSECGQYFGKVAGGLGIARFFDRPGDSGAPIYDEGYLVGTVHGSATNGDGVDWTTFQEIVLTSDWLEGT